MRINEKINAIAIDYLSDAYCQSIIRLHEILVQVSFGGENIIFLVSLLKQLEHVAHVKWVSFSPCQA